MKTLVKISSPLASTAREERRIRDASNPQSPGWRYGVVLGCLLLAGCGSGYEIAPVAGTVTLGGKPLPDAAITFQPLGGNGTKEPGTGSYGRTDAQGRFSLRMIANDQAGAIVGNHSVTISTGKSDPTTDASHVSGEKVPVSYRNGSQRFNVPAEGTAQADFAIPAR